MAWSGLYLPAGQMGHEVEPESEAKVPAAHMVQSFRLSWFEASVPLSLFILPAGQSTHVASLVAAVDVLYLPAEQMEQVERES